MYMNLYSHTYLETGYMRICQSTENRVSNLMRVVKGISFENGKNVCCAIKFFATKISSLSDIQRNRTDFFIINKQSKIHHAGVFEAQIADGKNQMRDGGGIADSPHVKVAGDRLHVHLAVKAAGFDAEGVVGKFPQIKTYADDHRKLGVNAGEIAGDDRVKSPHNGQFAAVFLGKIAKGKKFYFHTLSSIVH